MKYLNKALLVTLVAGLSVSATLAQAEDQAEDIDAQSDQQLSQLMLDCRAIDSSLERLDCYDRLARTLDSQVEEAARSQQEVTAAPQQSASDDFGREHRRQVPEGEDDRRYVQIEEAWQNPRGLWRFRLADGSEWHQTQAETFTYSEDDNYYIRRGILSSFWLGWDGNNRNIRVRRVD